MKPGRNNLLMAMGTMGLLVAATGRLQAADAIPMTINIQATATRQDTETYHDPVYRFSISTVKITTKDILNLVADHYGPHFRSGSKLVLTNGDVWVVSSAGTYRQNLTSDGVLSYSSTSNAFSRGWENLDTCQISETVSGVSEMDFDDLAGTQFFLYGSSQDTISFSAKDRRGDQKASESITLTGVGANASINGTNAVVSGTFKASGKRTGPASVLCPLPH
jgi:hypothetical protein